MRVQSWFAIEALARLLSEAALILSAGTLVKRGNK